jgi:hypothetical protein
LCIEVLVRAHFLDCTLAFYLIPWSEPGVQCPHSLRYVEPDVRHGVLA